MLPSVDLLRSGSRALGLVAGTAGFLAAAQLHEQTVPGDERPAVFQRYMRVWARSMLGVFGVRLHVSPGPPQLAERPRLVVANHRSPLDVAALLSTFGGHALSRADMADWPILGLAARKAETIFVDRQSTRSGASAIRSIRSHLKQNRSVLVFPEGGTFRGDEVRPFKGGTFAALKGLDAEVYPAGLVYDEGAEFVDEAFLAHIKRVAARPRLRLCLRVGSPIRTSGRDTRALASEAQQQVQALVHQARDDWRQRQG